MTFEAHYRRNHAARGTHEVLLSLVQRRTDVLDVGCASGYLGSDLAAIGCRVWGVDVDADAVAATPPTYEDAKVLDLEVAGELPWDQTFDVIVAADVLEHIRDPERTLALLVRYLRPFGRIIISLPNVAHLSVRLPLLAGRFPYGDSGILDRTHCRLFTYSSALALVRSAGLRPEVITGGSNRFGAIVQSRFGRAFRGALAYNIIIQASKDRRAPRPGAEPSYPAQPLMKAWSGGPAEGGT
jgi:SAM-dependent methyltransferase